MVNSNSGSQLDGMEESTDSISSLNMLNESDLEVSAIDDADIESIRARVKEMEEEAEKIRQLQVEVDRQLNLSNPSSPAATAVAGANGFPMNGCTLEEKVEMDNRSIYVGNVDYGATAVELEKHFHGCGAVNRVTILCNKYDGHPKGFAYIEFNEKDAVQTAMALDESLFKGRPIKVLPKRTNRPGFSTTNRPPRGRGHHQAAQPRFFRGFYGPFQPMRRPVLRRGVYFTPY